MRISIARSPAPGLLRPPGEEQRRAALARAQGSAVTQGGEGEPGRLAGRTTEETFKIESATGPGREPPKGVIDQMVNVEEGVYDRDTAYILAAASAWTYSDADALGRMLTRRGIANECVSVEFKNDALFVDSTAYVVQSHDRRLAILCFSGTEPRNHIDWLTDASVRADTFPSVGNVHGGFYRATAALWPVMRDLLLAAASGASVCRALEADQALRSCPLRGSLDRGAEQRPAEDGPRSGEPQPLTEEGDAPAGQLEALYITGHSLGGALAVLAAALIYSERQLAGLRPLLKGVYTYGQPMVGGPTFARHFDEKFGKKLFRHIYGNDIVPRLPPITTGKFAHFGQEYASTSAGWAEQERPVTQAIKMSLCTAIGLLAWVRDQLPGLSWLRLPVSWGDHAPLYYLRTSQAAHPGSEFE